MALGNGNVSSLSTRKRERERKICKKTKQKKNGKKKEGTAVLRRDTKKKKKRTKKKQKTKEDREINLGVGPTAVLSPRYRVFFKLVFIDVT